MLDLLRNAIEKAILNILLKKHRAYNFLAPSTIKTGMSCVYCAVHGCSKALDQMKVYYQWK